MIEVGSLFLLDQVFEDADVFGLRNLDTKRLVRLVTVNETRSCLMDSITTTAAGTGMHMSHFSSRSLFCSLALRNLLRPSLST